MSTNGSKAIMQYERAPYSQEAEEAVIGAALTDPQSLDKTAPIVTFHDFYILRHAYIWEALTNLHERREVADFVTAQEEIRALGYLDSIGGPAYLLQLINNTPTSRHAEAYAMLVKRAAVRRRLLACADEFKALAIEEDLPLEKVLAEAASRFATVQDASLENDDESLASIVARITSEVEYRMENPDQIGIPSGFRDQDELLCGYQRTDLIITAARPGMGKTSKILTEAFNMAKLGVRVGICSLEMNREQLVQRLLSIETGINTQAIRMGRLTPQQWSLFVKASGYIPKLPIAITDMPRLTPDLVRTKALRWMNSTGLDMLYVDYLQILGTDGRFRENRTAEVGYFAREMKQLARELKIPVHCAAQLNRNVEERNDKRPVLSDLRDSGEIEQEADVVMFIYRDAVYNEATEFPNRADIIVAKHRNGPTGTFSLYFEKSLTKFADKRTQMIDLSQLSPRYVERDDEYDD